VEPGTNPAFLYQQNSLRDALVAASTLNIFNNHADRVRLANLAQTVNVLQSLVLTQGRQILLTPTYWVFDLYKVHQNAKLIPIQFNSPDYTSGNDKIPALNVSASKDSNGVVHITLVNLYPSKAISIQTSIDGNYKTVTGKVLTSAKLTDVNTFEQPGKVVETDFKGAKLTGKKLAVELPAKSIVLLEVK
jgi:alpha-N-arabinofuranosidase